MEHHASLGDMHLYHLPLQVRNLTTLHLLHRLRPSSVVERHTSRLREVATWLMAAAFTLVTALSRLSSYALLLIHLNFFSLPATAIFASSLLLHLLLRGSSDLFYVPTTKMDVLLTAACCALVPTPTSSDVRAHNLLQVVPSPATALQVHTALTNLLLLLAGVAAVFLNLDYGLPIVWRPEEVAKFTTQFIVFLDP